VAFLDVLGDLTDLSRGILEQHLPLRRNLLRNKSPGCRPVIVIRPMIPTHSACGTRLRSSVRWRDRQPLSRIAVTW